MTSLEWTLAVSRPPPGVIGEEPKHCCCSPYILKKMLDLSLLSSPTFLLLAISGAIAMLGFFVPFIYLSAIGQSVGIEKGSATFLVSIIGIANTIGRVMCGWLADNPHINALVINNVALTVGGLATAFVPYFNTFTLLVIYSCVFGLCMGNHSFQFFIINILFCWIQSFFKCDFFYSGVCVIEVRIISRFAWTGQTDERIWPVVIISGHRGNYWESFSW